MLICVCVCVCVCVCICICVCVCVCVSVCVCIYIGKKPNFRALGGQDARENLALQNIQARTRML